MERRTAARWRARKLALLCSALTAATWLTVPSAVASVPPVTSVTSISAPTVLAPYPGMGLYAPKQGHAADSQRQVDSLRKSGKFLQASKLAAMTAAPTATWLVGGTPQSVSTRVQATTTAAAAKNQVPVFVAYNVPFRDCSQYSAGGARTTAEYRRWIDGLVTGIGKRPALVILEPDSLGIIPWHTSPQGSLEWCKPSGASSATAAADRYALLNYAVDKLSALPRATVYLDGGHSGWLDVGDSAGRLVKAGVRKADGFFLNVSHFETTEKQLSYGTWVSKCIHYATNPADGGKRLGRYSNCAGQYYPASPHDTRTWGKTDAWYTANVDRAAGAPTAARPLTHFVVDTSRNGRGVWVPTAGSYPNPETWCNPPGRGLGYAPTTTTRHPLADAFLWVKVPGESDGQCNRGLGRAAFDPVWKRVDPPSGSWFPEQALSLIAHAGPVTRR